MPQRVLDAKVDFYNPASGALRYSLTTNLRRIELNETATDQADDCGIDVSHDFADLDDFIVGDECKVYVKRDTDGALTHIWTGIVDSINSQRRGQSFADLPIKAQDFVYWTLAHTYITDSYADMDASAIVRSIISNYVSALTCTTTEAPDMGITVPSIAFNGESVLSALRRLAQFANATFKGDKDKKLYFFEKASQSSGVSIDGDDVVRGSFNAETQMADFGNVVTVRGGKRKVQDSASSGSFSSWTTLSGLVRKTARVFFSKSRVARVDIWTDADTPSVLTGGLTVRIQADNAAGTAPVDETNAEFDLASITLAAADLTNGGWTSFNLPEHIAPPGAYVWVIVESDSNSQRVGLNASSALMYRSYFDLPIIVQKSDIASIATYGRRELQPVTNDNIATEEEADELASRILAEHKDPLQIGSYEVLDPAALAAVTPGKTVSATFAKDGIPAGTDLIVETRQSVYDAETGVSTVVHGFVGATRQRSVRDVLRSFNDRIKRLEDKDSATPVLYLVTSVHDELAVADTVTATETTDTGSAWVLGTYDTIGFVLLG